MHGGVRACMCVYVCKYRTVIRGIFALHASAPRRMGAQTTLHPVYRGTTLVMNFPPF